MFLLIRKCRKESSTSSIITTPSTSSGSDVSFWSQHIQPGCKKSDTLTSENTTDESDVSFWGTGPSLDENKNRYMSVLKGYVLVLNYNKQNCIFYDILLQGEVMGTGQSTGQSAPARAMAPHNFCSSRGRRSTPTRKEEHVREQAKIQEEHVREEAQGTSGSPGMRTKEG